MRHSFEESDDPWLEKEGNPIDQEFGDVISGTGQIVAGGHREAWRDLVWLFNRLMQVLADAKELRDEPKKDTVKRDIDPVRQQAEARKIIIDDFLATLRYAMEEAEVSPELRTALEEYMDVKKSKLFRKI